MRGSLFVCVHGTAGAGAAAATRTLLLLIVNGDRVPLMYIATIEVRALYVTATCVQTEMGETALWLQYLARGRGFDPLYRPRAV